MVAAKGAREEVNPAGHVILFAYLRLVRERYGEERGREVERERGIERERKKIESERERCR